jgi:hypothetical protein
MIPPWNVNLLGIKNSLHVFQLQPQVRDLISEKYIEKRELFLMSERLLGLTTVKMCYKALTISLLSSFNCLFSYIKLHCSKENTTFIKHFPVSEPQRFLLNTRNLLGPMSH